MKQNKDRALLIFSMVIFSTIGIFRKYIPVSSSVLSMARGAIGMLFLLLLVSARKNNYKSYSSPSFPWAPSPKPPLKKGMF